MISNVSDLTLQSVIVNKDKPGVYINSSDIVDACDRLKEHFDSTFNGTGGSTGGTKGGPSGKTPEGNYTYDVLIGNKYTTITLDAPLTEGSKTDTDGDGIPDWEEMNKLYSFDFIFNEGYADSIFRNIVTNPTEREQLFNSLRGRNVYVITSDPTKVDSDGDKIPDGNDNMPMKTGLFKYFGTSDYEKEVNEKAAKMCRDIKAVEDPIKNKIIIEAWNKAGVNTKSLSFKLGSDALVAKAAINVMMEDVDNCEEYIRYNEKYNKYVPKGEWMKFCEFFNKKVETYGNMDENIHYFRLKLNRTPDSFADLVADKDNWFLYDKAHTSYHMNNTCYTKSEYKNSSKLDYDKYKEYFPHESFTSTNESKYPSYSTYGNEYNMKFVDKYGMNEVVVTPNQDLSGMDEMEIYNYLIKAENWQILTDDYEKGQNNPNFKYDPVNVGTYNYSAYDFDYVNLDGSTKKTSEKLHNKYDVYPYLGGNKEEYSNWGNVAELKYGNTKTQRKNNYNYYDKTAEKDNYIINWNKKFAK